MFLYFQQTEQAVDKLWDKLNGWYEAIILRVPNLIIAILVVILFYFLARGIASVLRKILRKKLKNQSVRRLIVKMIYVVMLSAGFFIALGVLDLDKALTSILAGAGVVALAIGLALQGTLSNTFSGVMLSFLPKIRINDFVETSEHSGFVEEINLRNVVLRRPDNHIVVMPNSKFIEEPFINYSFYKRGRITITCGVGYESNLREVKQLVLDLIKAEFPQNSNEKIEFYYTEFGDSSINFITRFYIDFTKKSQMYTTQSEAIMRIKETFDANNINIPFPIRTIKMDK